MAKPPTSAEAIGLIQSYHDWYRPPGCGKKYKKEELVADLLTRVRPVGDAFVWHGGDWELGEKKRIGTPHDSDIETMGSLSVTELMKLCSAIDDYYTITPSARRNVVAENIRLLKGFMTDIGGKWRNTKPEFRMEFSSKEKGKKEKPMGVREAKKAEKEADFLRAVAEAPVGPPPVGPPKKLEVPAPVPPEEEEEEMDTNRLSFDDREMDTNRLSFDDRETLKDMYGITFTRWVWKGKEVIPDERKPDRYYVARGNEELDDYLWKAYGPYHDEIPWEFQGLILPDGSINIDEQAPILDFSEGEESDTTKLLRLKTAYTRFMNMYGTAIKAPYNDKRDRNILKEKEEGFSKYMKDERRDMSRADMMINSMEDAITWQEGPSKSATADWLHPKPKPI